MTAPFTELEKPLNEYSLLCRGCLASSGEMKNMMEWGLLEDFHKITEISTQDSENLSKLLCTNCEENLMSCKRFREQCRHSNMVLKNMAMKHDNPGSQEEIARNSNRNKVTCVQYDRKIVLMITAPDMQAKICLPCPYDGCKGNFTKKSDLFFHLLKIHQVDKKIFIDLQYYCTEQDCAYALNSGKNKYFTGRKFLNQHYNKAHKTIIFQCDVCLLDFSTSGQYYRHLETCSTKFSCEICDKKYNTHESLLVHLKRRHVEYHKQYLKERKSVKRKSKLDLESKKAKTEFEKLSDYMCDSPKRSFATQTLKPEDNIRNDVTLPSWKCDSEAKTDEISTQTVFEDLLSLKSQTSEDESIFFSENVSLSDIQTQTFPVEFGLSRSNKETITSETQSPDLSIKETQTCYCLYDSPRSFKLFDSVVSSPNINFTSTETQTVVKSDVLLSFHSTETQTCFDDSLSKDSL